MIESTILQVVNPPHIISIAFTISHFLPSAAAAATAAAATTIADFLPCAAAAAAATTKSEIRAMTAYGAVISLHNTIHHILHSSHFTLVEPSPTIIQQAYDELQPLQEILERLDETSKSRSRKKVNELDGRIKHKIWEFEDKLESLLYQQILPQFPAANQVELTTRRRSRYPLFLLFSIDLESLEDEVASFIHELKNLKREYINELGNMAQEPCSTTIGFECGGTTKPKMIGLSDQFQQTKRNLMRQFLWVQHHIIVGTAGIGKTTLARELYEDADVVSFFECRAWVTVTRTMVDEGPQFDEVVKGILAQLCGGDDQNVGDYLVGKRCLVVLDDVWEQRVFYRLRKSLPYIKYGFYCFLLTSREIIPPQDEWNVTVARFLTEEESKDLLCHKVFGGKENCPVELDKAATKIARKCEGLPLMIVTVADSLSKSQNTEPDYWNDVAEERNSVFTDAYNEISKVLFPSYDYLPQYLKMPFLFMGVFPPDYEIPESKLMNMMNAEGWFLHTNKRQSLTESVWDCLDKLCLHRSLVLFKRKSVYSHGRSYYPISLYKTCWLHSSWRYVCRVEARKNKLYRALHKLVDSSDEEGVVGQRGLCLQNNILFGNKEFCNSVGVECASIARSLLFMGPFHQYPIPVDVGFRLLRELDALQLRFYAFPTEILTLVQLKYLALTCNGELPPTISKLFSLRVLIVHPHTSIRQRRAPSCVPIQIWEMQELEHIEILGKSLRPPNHDASLLKLLTLVGVNASICSIWALSRSFPNIRKLDVRVELTPYDDLNDLLSCFACISTLGSLETLKCSIMNPVIQYRYVVPAPPGSLLLPRGLLRKLHLSGTSFPWEYMDVIGSLPHLQVLKLRSYAFRGPNWKAPEAGSFRILQYLLIEDSDLVCLNLPLSLSHLSLKHCYKLEMINWPSCKRIDRKIELVDCNPLVFTWAKELEPNANSYNDVTISSSFEKEKPMIINFIRPKEYEYVRTRWTHGRWISLEKREND